MLLVENYSISNNNREDLNNDPKFCAATNRFSSGSECTQNQNMLFDHVDASSCSNRSARASGFIGMTGLSKDTNSIHIMEKDTSISIYQHHFNKANFHNHKFKTNVPMLPFKSYDDADAQINSENISSFSTLHKKSKSNELINPKSILKNPTEQIAVSNSNRYYSGLQSFSTTTISREDYSRRSNANHQQPLYTYRPNHHRCKRFDLNYKTLEKNWRVSSNRYDTRGILLLLLLHYLLNNMLFSLINQQTNHLNKSDFNNRSESQI